MSEIDELYERLKKLQEPKGYYFNADRERTFELLAALLVNKKRYGYMACPCRLASGDREWDRDIACPCSYREPDVKEYGSCYCNLYVSAAWNEGTIPHAYVPERRPPEKIAPLNRAGSTRIRKSALRGGRFLMRDRVRASAHEARIEDLNVRAPRRLSKYAVSDCCFFCSVRYCMIFCFAWSKGAVLAGA